MKKLVLTIGILAIFISCYDTISGESIKSNLVGFILGIGLILSYFESNKSEKLRK
ncbi:MAG: hypothetical protein QM499_01335 [Flavobacteriaceae bacterium]